MSTLERAIAIATEAHRGQKDKVGQPYILHPLRVMFRVGSDTERIVAVLHDVLEDTPWTADQLRAEGFSEEVLQALANVTKRDGESYESFVLRAGSHPVSKAVKRADLEDNMDLRRLEEVTEKDAERLRRYVRAWRSLNSG
jgi:(p)ppGpp synthase/HD superfamily hydrolase